MMMSPNAVTTRYTFLDGLHGQVPCVRGEGERTQDTSSMVYFQHCRKSATKGRIGQKRLVQNVWGREADMQDKRFPFALFSVERTTGNGAIHDDREPKQLLARARQLPAQIGNHAVPRHEFVLQIGNFTLFLR